VSAALEVRDLTVGYRGKGGAVDVVVRDVSFDLHGGRLLGLAGESGSGKSTAALAAIGYTAPGSVRLSGRALLGDIDLLATPMLGLRRIWGSRVAYVAQDASQSLSPLMRIEKLLAEPLRLHLGLRGAPLRRRTLALLEDVGIPDPESALRRFPYQFSGGQQQRIALAIAMACEPGVLILDEPTTGLDVTTQAQIARLIDRLIKDSGTASVLISHDLALLGTICDEMAIMYAGEIVEQGAAPAVGTKPRHPYTAALLDAVPRVDEPGLVIGIPGLPSTSVIEGACAFAPRCRFAQDPCSTLHPTLGEVAPEHAARCLRASDLGPLPSQRRPPLPAAPVAAGGALLDVSGLVCSYRRGHGAPVVDQVSLHVDRGETVALVGESGSGKSTALRAIAGLHRPDGGTVSYAGASLAPHVTGRSRTLHRDIQIVFQDPHASLNPRHTVGEIIGRPISILFPERSAAERRARVLELLAHVRLDGGLTGRRPHQLSGGQKQRVAIARAFAAEPRLLLCDEVVSALDVSVQASILELIADLTADTGTAVLFVTHDLAVVRAIAERVYVMRSGKILEKGPTEQIFNNPQSPYTAELLAAVPRLAAARG
jgi:peptide/nickel transport system ATP-binding protein